MKKSTNFSKQQNTIKKEITELIENTFLARVLHVTGSSIKKVTRLSNPPPWWINAVILGIVVHIPATLMAIIIKIPIGHYLFGTVSDIVVVLFASLFYPMMTYILKSIKDYIIDNLEETQEVSELRSFLLQMRDHRRILIHALVISVLWLIIWIPSSIELVPGFKNGYFFLSVWTGGFFGIGLVSYYLIWIMQFPNQIGKYRFKLYELNPSQSEVIVHISNLFSRPFWVLVILLAMGIVGGSFIGWPLWVILAIQGTLWILLIIQFVNGRATINKIIAVKKWQTLNKLQEQIQKLKNKTVTDTESINNLMDLHERVYNASNRKQTVTSTLEFFNQLLFPFIAALAANYKDVLEFFNR